MLETNFGIPSLVLLDKYTVAFKTGENQMLRGIVQCTPGKDRRLKDYGGCNEKRKITLSKTSVDIPQIPKRTPSKRLRRIIRDNAEKIDTIKTSD